jgi:uridine kinase
MSLGRKPLIIGIAGGSGSGKTYFTNTLVKKLGKEKVTRIYHDSYYKDHRSLTVQERENFNYDHPDSLDTDLLISHIEQLIKGREAEIPDYDMTTHSRKEKWIKIQPAPAIVVDGILIFENSRLRELMDLRLFMDADLDTMFIRRLQRDIKERGRTEDSVVNQYLNTVKPMYLEYVLPSRKYAHIFVSDQNRWEVITFIVNMIETRAR